MITKALLATLFIGPCVGLLSADDLKQDFRSPPDSARPGVYWYFMDGNQNRGEMVKDLDAMADVGIGSVLFLEVNIGTPVGPIAFMSEEWQNNVVNAFKHAGNIGMEVILGTGPGWAGSGGSWIKPEQSMQHLVGNQTKVHGPSVFENVLPVPAPHKPNHFAGMVGNQIAARNQWYQDVAVLAMPTPAGDGAKIDDADIKTLKDVRPYSIDKTAPRFVMPHADPAEPDAAKAINPARIIDLTPMMKPDGTLRWEVPEGDWTIMRFVARSTGQTTRPAPRTGHGFECDKFSEDAYRHHWNSFQKILIDKLGPLTPGKGLTTVHLDSWEMSSQNWTAEFRKEFIKRRGYDPQPYYPAYMGLVVGSMEKTERFLWDLRKTSQELLLENHAGAIKKIAGEHKLVYSNEPYDMNPAGNLDLGSVADIPGAEFWNVNDGPDTQYSCIEAVSIAHTMGKPRVNAESFTTHGLAYLDYPGSMKNQTDWAFAMGINGIIFHTYQHQPLGDGIKPGMTMGPYGVQWHRNQTMWHLFPGYHQYIARCSNMLRQGQAVADVLYLTPEGAPNIFEAPQSAMTGAKRVSDKKGYNFDAVSPRILKMRAQVEDGMISFPGGTRYRLLVLPNVETMTPETLATIVKLVEGGATVVGNPVRKSPSLVGYPACDEEVGKMSAKLWGEQPTSVRTLGKGRVIPDLGTDKKPRSISPKIGDDLYPAYDVTAGILRGMDVPEDFTSTGKIRYGHRRTESKDIYFVSNTVPEKVSVNCSFRIVKGVPELWNPVTGETRVLTEFSHEGEITTVPMNFEPHQSFFVIFPRSQQSNAAPQTKGRNFPQPALVTTLAGPWDVSFDPKWGGPENVVFPALQDWTKREEPGIKYYSGSATYRKTFDLPLKSGTRMVLDLGVVCDIARVKLNGKDCGIVWCAPWSVDITDAAKAKDNRIEIEIVNRWQNRLLGDTLPPDKDARVFKWKEGLLGGKEYKMGRYTFTTNPNGPPLKTLLPSGLIGPVNVMSSAE